MTQRELAGDRLSVSLISRIESGNVQPSFKTLTLIARRLGVSLAFFQDGQESFKSKTVSVVNAVRELFEKEEYGQAITIGQEMLERSDCLDGDTEAANSLKMLVGRSLYNVDRVPEAIIFIDDVYHKTSFSTHPVDSMESLFWLANCHYRSDQYALARTRYKEVHDKTRNLKRMNDLHCQSEIYIATCAYRLGDLEDAMEIYGHLFSASTSGLPPRLKIDAGMGLSWTHYKMHNVEKAIEIGGEVRSLSLKHGKYELPRIEHALGIYRFANDPSSKAAEYWKHLRQTFGQTSQPIEKANVLEHMATYYLAVRDDPDETERCARQALGLLPDSRQTLLRARLFRILGQVEQHRQHAGFALHWYQIALSLFEVSQARQEMRETTDLVQTLPE